MSKRTMSKNQGHWVLARMGKKVLRPGGKELTEKLIGRLDILPTDDIVEFAPGLGYTAGIALSRGPKSYTGIEFNEEAALRLRHTLTGRNLRIVIGDAAESTLEPESADKVYGEAMLTMQADNKKSAIIREAHRILRPGGLYGIHELGLVPDGISTEKKAEIQKDLAKSIRVNARPLSRPEWTELLEQEGFRVLSIDTVPMLLLEPRRLIEDEGWRRAMKIAFNVMIHPKERKQITGMREAFRRHRSHMNALAVVAQKL
ncbi:MAG: class I SAM-dependent methyltransferase [Vulcanimicrobiota bacterium]